MATIMLVFLGSAIGGVCRYRLSNTIQAAWPGRFPLGTLLVNVSGCLLIGLVWAWMTGSADLTTDHRMPPTTVLLQKHGALHFLVLGVLGGYTTVSSVALNTLELLQERRHLAAVVNLLGSWLICLLAAFAGYWVMTA